MNQGKLISPSYFLLVFRIDLSPHGQWHSLLDHRCHCLGDFKKKKLNRKNIFMDFQLFFVNFIICDDFARC